MGLASVVNIAFQILRVKVLAVLLGPGGMGLFGMFNSILTTTSSLAGMGISSSAVRQIAEARGKADERGIGEIAYVLTVLTIGLGAIGATLLFMLREQIAHWTFGDVTYAVMVGWLAIGVFATVASQSISALLQGYRRIGDQARLQVWSGACSTILAIGAIVWVGQDGVIIFVVAMPIVATLLAWTYARRIGLTIRRVTFRPFSAEARRMIGMGSAIMVSGALQGCALLTLRSQITQNLGIEITGLFQAAWALSFIYMGFMLDAMGKDYYPNLTEHVGDRQKTVQLMREQVNVAIVLVGPLIVAMIAFAPLIVDILYARVFRDAVPLIQWMGLGNLLKVASWPLGFLLLAKARTREFLILEIIWTISFLGIAWLLKQSLGLVAVGLAFLCAYALHLLALYWLSRSLTGFRFDRENIRLMLAYGALVGAVFLAARHDYMTGYVVGLVVLLLSGVYSYQKLARMIGKDPIDLIKEKYINKVKGGIE